MSLVNKVILIGNLGQDPEVKFFGEGKALTRISLATNEFVKDKSGERVPSTQWHNLVFWGKKAEAVSDFCKKGSKLIVEGKIINRSFDNKAGEKQYVHEIQVLNFEMLDKKLEELDA